MSAGSDKSLIKEREKFEKEKKDWVEKEKKLRDEIKELKKSKKSFFGKKDDQRELEKSQIINEVQEQMAEEYRTKFDTMKENIRMMLDQNTSLENEIKKKDQLIEEIQSSFSSSSVDWVAIKDNIQKKITDQKDQIISSSLEKLKKEHVDPLTGEMSSESQKMFDTINRVVPLLIDNTKNVVLDSVEVKTDKNEQTKVAELMDRIVKMENEMVGKVLIDKDELKDLKQHITASTEKEKYYKDKADKIEKEMNEKQQSTIEEYESKIQKTIEQVTNDTTQQIEEKWKKENDTLKQKEVALKEQLETICNNLQEEKKQLLEDNSQINTAKVELQVQVSEMTNELIELRKLNDEVKSGKITNQKTEEAINELKTCNNNLEMRFEELQSENDFLKGVNEEYKTRIRELQMKLDDTLIENNKLTENTLAYKQKHDSSKQKRKTLKDSIYDIQQSVDQKQQQIDTLLNEIERDKNIHEDEIQAQKKTIHQLEGEIKEKEFEIENVKIRMKNNDELLQQRIAEIKSHDDSSSSDELQLQINKLNALLEDATKQINHLTDVNSKNAVVLEAVRAGEERDKREKESKKKHYQQYSTGIRSNGKDANQDQLRILGDKIGELQIEKSRYVEQLNQLESVLIQKENEMKLWKSDVIGQYLKNAFGKVVEKKKLKDVVAKLQAVVEEVVTQNIALQKQLDECKQLYEQQNK
ncbi:E3 ubiquitin protein ligase BRE1A [Entamoeba marina]